MSARRPPAVHVIAFIAAIAVVAPATGISGGAPAGRRTGGGRVQQPCGGHPCYGAATVGPFAGTTSQGRPIALEVAHGGSAIVALRFAVSYRCAHGGPAVLRVAVYRPIGAWEILDSDGHGFSDWFAGPIGHDFHIVGTFATGGRQLRGRLHSRLPLARRGMCDSGRVRYTARAAGQRLRIPAVGAISLARFRSVRLGTSVARLPALLGPPPDHETFAPAGLVLAPYLSSGEIVYLRRGRPHQALGLIIGRGKVVSRDRFVL